MYEEYEVIAKKHTAVYHTMNLAFMMIGLLAVLFSGFSLYIEYGLNQILIIIGVSVLGVLFIYGIFSIFLKIYENTLISTFLQKDIREATLDSCKIQVATMKNLKLTSKESQ